ncbi:ferritin-like domain-containing protein [Streptomyces sp. NPDC006879]|uniref:ferritin-like domain-containing protein n=1 Tax=Streptomyces sp. NPDC006879 TaxID=3364767 RepID=UPI00368BABC8
MTPAGLPDDDRDTPQRAAALTAAQSALAAEHAAVYGYGVIGARTSADRRAEARQDYAAHRDGRDALLEAVHELGGSPRPSLAAYALPFGVSAPADTVRLAVWIEERIAGSYGDLVRAGEGQLRTLAAEALREAALRAARWRGGGVAFPGLAERAPTS